MTTLKVAIVQTASVSFVFGDGIDKAVRLASEAIEGGSLNRGGSTVIAPDARIVAQAGEGEETLFAELDPSEIGQGLASLDTDGHYSRPDVFELRIRTESKDGVVWS